MKRFLFFMALLCIWCISFNSVKAVSNAELQDTSRFEHIVSKGTQVVEMVNILS